MDAEQYRAIALAMGYGVRMYPEGPHWYKTGVAMTLFDPERKADQLIEVQKWVLADLRCNLHQWLDDFGVSVCFIQRGTRSVSGYADTPEKAFLSAVAQLPMTDDDDRQIAANRLLAAKARITRVSETGMGLETLHGAEYAALLLAERIPFRVDYPMEYQAQFYVAPEYNEQALKLMMKLRGEKLR